MAKGYTELMVSEAPNRFMIECSGLLLHITTFSIYERDTGKKILHSSNLMHVAGANITSFLIVLSAFATSLSFSKQL